MFIRPSAQRSLSLSKTNTLSRPSILSRCSSSRSGPLSSHRLLVTRPDLLPWQRNGERVGHGTHQERSLATALDDARPQKDLDMPYGLPTYSQPSSPQSIYEFRPFDPAKPLIVKNDYEQPTKIRLSAQGVPGDLESMLSVFNACLHVQHLDRAALVLKRLDDFELMSGPELINLHNRYLAANIERFYSQSDIKWAESMQSWYETRIRATGLPQTPETIAYMLKISLLSGQDQDKLERRINRYMGMVPGDAGLQVYSYSDILSDQDLARITSLCTTHNYSPDDFVTEGEEIAPLGNLAELGTQEDVSSQQSTKPDEEVMAVPQKGLGLKSLRDVLSFFTDIQGSDISKLPLNEQREIQARLERDCVEAAISRWREEHEALMKMGRNTALSTNALNSQLYDWQCALEKRIKEDLASLAKAEAQEKPSSEDNDKILIAPFLRQSTPARLAAVTILSTLNQTAQAATDNGATIATAVSNLAKALEEDIRLLQNHEARKAKKAQRRVLRRQNTEVEQPTTSSLAASPADESSANNIVEPEPIDGQAWPVAIKTKVGAFLILALIDTAKITVSREHPTTKQLVSQVQPAFSRSSIFKKGKRVGMISPNKYLTELMKREPRGDFLARHLPMLVQPDPWTKFDKGGFLEFPSTIIRVKNGEKDQKVYTEAAIQRGDLDQVAKGLDVLGRTAWKINRAVFSVMLEAWNTGKGIANFPPLNPDLPLPEEPEASDDPMARKMWIQQVKQVENEKSGLHSERCFINFQMEIANAFKEQTFYFPHNMDFRGRAYPIPTYLNHMGADNARGLLIFAKGRELGERGLKWLKVHLANVSGYDKASILEREEYTMKNLDNIIESATNPLNGSRWWLKAEDPWQCLAACFELKAAMALPDPTKYVSHLPVHQDGTCNGLQHYAALGGDRWGAQQVNLEPGERPADVYSAVADLVKQSIAEDVKAENPLAKIMDGKITRKVVKQTVMTNVYGVTFIGARAQVQKQIDAAYPKLKTETGVPHILLASYVASKIFKALSTMFSGAHDIQYWLAECAGRVCRALTPEQLDKMAEDSEALKAAEDEASVATTKRGSAKTKKSIAKNKRSKITAIDLLNHWRSTIVWTTPLRLPVVQPYRKGNTRTITTALQDLNLVIPERSDPVNRRKQLQAFPPNFVHSLDATHMLLSALESHEKGLTFAAVHDSFWTHAADIDVMNGVLRDAFIRIHSEDVIQRLASEFEARYKGSLYLAKVESGSKVEKEIASFRRASRLSLHDEVLMERERRRLLQSTDPEEVLRGQEMRTPASIFEEFNAQQVSDSASEIGDAGFGQVPDSEEVVKSALAEVNANPAVSQNPNKSKFTIEDPARLKSYLEVGGFEAELGKDRKSAPKTSAILGVWLPITFPDVPRKGDFDVKRLKDSQYFFS